MEEIFHVCLDHCSALNGVHATALVGNIIYHFISSLSLTLFILWLRVLILNALSRKEKDMVGV